MKSEHIKKMTALFLAGSMLLCGCGTESTVQKKEPEKTIQAEEKDETADASAEKAAEEREKNTEAAGESETASSEENGTDNGETTAKSETAEETEETEKTETETGDRGMIIPGITIEQKEIPDTEGMEFTQKMGIGWNLGNTFDAYSDDANGDELSMEWLWCGEKTTKEMIDAVKAAGFQTLRLPVSWHNHVSGDDFTISSAWLDRVQEVLEYAVQDDLYVILNMHHDTDPAYCYPDKAHLEQSLSYMTAIWEQLAERFGDYDEHVIFESINEPRLTGTEHEWWLDPNAADCREAVECINTWNQNFVDTVRKTGGRNADRYLMVPGYGASADGVMNDAFVLPSDSSGKEGRLLVSVHAYIPYHFAMQPATEGESTDWFDASDAASTGDIDQMMEKLYTKFISSKIPVVIGEFGARDKNGNLQSRVNYAAYYVAAARASGISCCWWDNHVFEGDGEQFGLLDRKNITWKYPEIVDAMMRYAK